MQDVMLDLETLGIRPGCVVLSIGAVFFDINKGVLGQEYYRNIDRVSSERVGLKVEPETEAWWKNQEAAARLALQENPYGVLPVVKEFGAWFFKAGGKRVWSHGATFDIPIWDAVVAQCGQKSPWKYTMARDTRTAYDLWGFNPNKATREGTHHNALHDARHQARMLIQAFRGHWASAPFKEVEEQPSIDAIAG